MASEVRTSQAQRQTYRSLPDWSNTRKPRTVSCGRRNWNLRQQVACWRTAWVSTRQPRVSNLLFATLCHHGQRVGTIFCSCASTRQQETLCSTLSVLEQTLLLTLKSVTTCTTRLQNEQSSFRTSPTRFYTLLKWR